MFILAILSVIGAITYGIIQHLFIVEHEITQPTHTREGYQLINTVNALTAIFIAAFPALYLIEPFTH